MKSILIALVILALTLWSVLALASCTTTTYFIDGRMVTCQTCCVGTQCTVTCF